MSASVRLTVAALAVMSGMAFVPAGADAVVRHWVLTHTEGEFGIEDDCGTLYEEVVTLPHGAFDVFPIDPLTGTVMSDPQDGPQARVIAIAESGAAPYPALVYTLEGLPEVCNDPDSFGIWSLDYPSFRIGYSTDEYVRLGPPSGTVRAVPSQLERNPVAANGYGHPAIIPKLGLRCDSRGQQHCRGRLVLRTARKINVDGRRRRAVLGFTPFDLLPGGLQNVRLYIDGSKGRVRVTPGLLNRVVSLERAIYRKRIRARATATYRDEFGKRRKVTGTITVIGPRRRPRGCLTGCRR